MMVLQDRPEQAWHLALNGCLKLPDDGMGSSTKRWQNDSSAWPSLSSAQPGQPHFCEVLHEDLVDGITHLCVQVVAGDLFVCTDASGSREAAEKARLSHFLESFFLSFFYLSS